MPDLNHYIACLVDGRTIDELDREAQRRQRSRSFVVREAIREHLRRQDLSARQRAHDSNVATARAAVYPEQPVAGEARPSP